MKRFLLALKFADVQWETATIITLFTAAIILKMDNIHSPIAATILSLWPFFVAYIANFVSVNPQRARARHLRTLRTK